MSETCISITFPDLQRQIEWRLSYFTKISLKANEYKIGAVQYPGLSDVSQILYTLLPYNFNLIVSAKRFVADTTSEFDFEKSRTTP